MSDSTKENVHFSSKSTEWETPQDLFEKLNRYFGPFELDVCAVAENAKCTKFFTPEDNALEQDWAPHVCFMNPPYGRSITLWIEKAYNEALKGAVVVCLLPSRTDTRWWHNYVMKGKIHFIKGRLKFGNAKNSAPFPSVIVIFDKNIINGVNDDTWN